MRIINRPLTLNVFFQKRTNTVEIEIQGEKNNYHYSIDVIISDWVDENLVDEFINSNVLPNENVRNRFCFLPPSDQTVQLVFVPVEVYEMAIEKGTIPADEGYFMKEQ